jgi:DNA-binding SARP family transcriptional activator
MGLLRLAVLGPPEVLHDGSRLAFPLRKAQALLLYLAVEGGMHSRGKLAALLWPDSEPQVARKALRNALALLRHLLADPEASPAQHSHLLSSGELLGLDPQTPRELDLDVVQRAWNEAQRLTTPSSSEQRAALVTGVEHALSLVRGPFLDGFWLGEDAPFDEWVGQHRQQWQVRLQLLCERLSSWQEAGGEQEQAKATLMRWLALDPLSEEAYRRLMRVHLALEDPAAAARVYATCRARLAEELRVKPSADTVALAEHIRSTAARRGSPLAHPATATAQSRPQAELVAPLVGRQASFSQLVGSFQQARGGQAQAVLLLGEAGIGKTRLAREWVAWARAQGAEVLSGHAFEMGGRLPYQPLVDALRPRLEAENAPEDLLEDLWLAELARLLPELRVRYPDLPTPTEDELTAKGRLFEAVARLFDALARAGPLVLLLDDLQWVDEASLDLLRYLGRYWIKHGSRVLLLLTLRSEQLELTPALAAHLTDLGRDLPISKVTLQPLSQPQTLQLVQAITGVGTKSTRNGSERREHGSDQPSAAGTAPAAERETKLSALGDVLYAQTAGQPLYLLETLKLLRDRQWLVPRVDVDGHFRLELGVELATMVAQQQSQGALLPPSVRALILARLAPLSQAARQLVQGVAVLGTAAHAQVLWQLTEIGVQEGVEALEEAVKSGILREEEAGGGRLGSYRFSHDLLREVVYTELGAVRRQILHQRALARLFTEGALASELAYHARASGEAKEAYGYSVQAGMEAVAVFAVADAIVYYEQARALLQQHVQQIMPETSEVERLYVHLGQAYVFQNDWDRAQEALEELLAYGKQHQLPALASMTLNRLAILAVQQSFDKPQVRALLEEARQMAEISHEQRALAETEWNMAQIIGVMWEDPKRTLSHGEHALELARGIQDQELEARSLSSLGWIHLLGGDFEEAIRLLEAALTLYALLRNEPTAARELSLPSFAIGAPLTQPLTNRALEAWCWEMLAMAKLHQGQVQPSIDHSRRALALAKEIKNVWAQVVSTVTLTHGLLEAGAYEEALVLIQHTMALAPTLEYRVIFYLVLIALGSAYQALQQWEEERNTLEEAEAVAKALDLGPFLRMPTLTRLCMHYAVAGEWEAAYRYASKAIALRRDYNAALIELDFYFHSETEALLRGGDERQARAAVQRLGERLGSNRRFRIPYLRSLAVLAEWERHGERAIDILREAAGLAADLGLPAEHWQIQAALGTLYEAAGDPAQARTARASAARIIQELAQGINDEALRAHFLAGPQIRPLVQHVQSEAGETSQDHP